MELDRTSTSRSLAMNYRKVLAISSVALASMALAVAPGLKLTPGTVGNGAVAKWMPVNSGPGPANQVLLLDKMVPTSVFEAAGADIGRIAGTSYDDLNQLSWKLVSGPAGGGSPRWNVYYGPAGGSWEGVAFFEPA